VRKMRCEPLFYRDGEVKGFICPDGIYSVEEVKYKKNGNTYIVEK